MVYWIRPDVSYTESTWLYGVSMVNGEELKPVIVYGKRGKLRVRVELMHMRDGVLIDFIDKLAQSI